ncbi:M14 family metallopeptidase [Aureispira sp. CCB-E]|uniref:M14 family metallopeptidase n=1 Tax=Aureispira sp. CCB-E TaxID=3051121 RepID=UPI002868F11A|nr:M14 family metallopeptidase [Aureispira sp. CCB-E]WMX13934.1 M14 family metallopeptidase [Aureispira sp. CCB-E]
MKVFLTTLLFLFFSLEIAAQLPFELLTTPEKTAFEKTSTSEEVVAFVEAIQKRSDQVHTEVLLISDSGRSVPLVVMANPAVRTPEEAKASGKPIIYFQGNIHGGEVEGKEALMILMREILFGDKAYLLNNQIVIFVPNYNPDGNNKLSSEHRKSQEHCPHLAGSRRSGGDWDLNRDGIKMDAVETKGLMKNLILKWDPDVFVDMHTTNGVWHGNELTYAHSYHYAGHPATSDYTKDIMLPKIKKNVLDKYDLHFDIYGGYSLAEGWPPKKFYTYNHHPRYLVNQFGLRNKMAILSETFAHDKFYHRINSAHKFALEILEYTSLHGRQIMTINKKSATETIHKIKTQAGTYKNGVRFKMVPTTKPFQLRTYEYLPYTDSTGKTKYARTANRIDVPNVTNYSAFEATVTSTVPRGYILPAELKNIVEHLRAHGIVVEELTQKTSFSGEVFTIEQLDVNKKPFERHNMVTLKGNFAPANKSFPKGSYKVDLAQPLANLIFYLLEPQSDDGLVTWNFFDKVLYQLGVNNQPIEYPVFKYW